LRGDDIVLRRHGCEAIWLKSGSRREEPKPLPNRKANPDKKKGQNANSFVGKNRARTSGGKKEERLATIQRESEGGGGGEEKGGTAQAG